MLHYKYMKTLGVGLIYGRLNGKRYTESEKGTEQHCLNWAVERSDLQHLDIQFAKELQPH